MSLIRWQARIIHKNPIEPYTWEARYRPMGTLKQFGFDGYHYSREIDLARLDVLVIHGHPDSPITIPLPEPRPPDEVIIKAQTTYRMRLRGDGREVNVRYFFGYRYGHQRYLVEIDQHGRLWKTNNELAPDERWLGGGY